MVVPHVSFRIRNTLHVASNMLLASPNIRVEIRDVITLSTRGVKKSVDVQMKKEYK